MDEQPGADWTSGALLVAFSEAGHGSFWPATRPLPEGWRSVHGPCGIAQAREWIADPANAPPIGPSRAIAPDADRESVPERLARLAALSPERPAILFGHEALSRGELDAAAAAVSSSLAQRGIGQGRLVAVALERSPQLIGALLGVLRAGAAFLPVDPAYPAARVRMMLEDAGIAHCITTSGIAERLELPSGSNGSIPPPSRRPIQPLPRPGCPRRRTRPISSTRRARPGGRRLFWSSTALSPCIAAPRPMPTKWTRPRANCTSCPSPSTGRMSAG